MKFARFCLTVLAISLMVIGTDCRAASSVERAVTRTSGQDLTTCLSSHRQDGALYCSPSDASEAFAKPVMPFQLEQMIQSDPVLGAWYHVNDMGHVSGVYLLLKSGKLLLDNGRTFSNTAAMLSYYNDRKILVTDDGSVQELNDRIQGREAWHMPSLIPSFAIIIELLIAAALFMQLAPMLKRVGVKQVPEEMKRFSDVAGHAHVKKELREVITALRNPKSAHSDLVPSAMLFDGPPGNGKTLMAAAFAGELGLPFYSIAASDLIEMYAGLSSRRVRSLYRRVRRNPRGGVLFIDEFDAIAGARSAGGPNDGASSEREQLVAALLNELDGMQHKGQRKSGLRAWRRGKGRVITIAATNRVDILDSAITRSGRFDRKIHVPNPDIRTLAEIIRLHTRGVKLAKNISFETLAQMMAGRSGADAAFLVRQARLVALREKAQVITMHHFDEAVDIVLIGPVAEDVTLTEEERRSVAIHEAGHAIVALKTEGAMKVRKVTIVPRGNTLGMVVMLPETDSTVQTRQQLMAHVRVAMGGRAAEQVMFGSTRVGSGASQDIRQATTTLRTMGARLGMFEDIGLIEMVDGHGRVSTSPDAQALLDKAVSREAAEAYKEVVSLIETHRPELEALSSALLERQTLSVTEVIDILRTTSTGNQAEER